MIEYQELLFNDEAELISHLKFVNNELLDKVANLEEQLSEKEKKLEYKDRVIKQLQAIKRYHIGENGRLRAKNHTEKIELLEKISREFSMRVGIGDNSISTLNEIIDYQIEKLQEKTKC